MPHLPLPALCLLLCASLAAACSDGAPSRPADGGGDARHRAADASAKRDASRDAATSQKDTGAPDAGAPVDAGFVSDAGDAGDASEGIPDAIADTGVDVGPLFWPIDASVPIDGSVSTTYPAFSPNSPRVTFNGGPVLTSPVFVPIVVAGDPDLAQIEAFLAAVGPSDYWRSVTSEYGVGAGATARPIVCPDALDDGGLGTCLENAMSGDGGLSGLVAGSNGIAMSGADAGTQPLLVFFLPEGASFGIVGCNMIYGGVHGSVTIAGVTVVLATVSRCTRDGGPLNEFESLTVTASHELVEAATDPLLPSGYAGLDPDHANWYIPGNNDAKNVELGDMCETTFPVHPSDPDLSSFYVQRIWSNASIAAGHDPCIPELPGEVFYEAVPILPDEVAYDPGSVLGVAVPLGGHRTIDLALYSDGPTGGPWNIDIQQDFGTGVVFGLSSASGQNGSVVPLTIDAPVDAGLGYTQAWVSSSTGDAGAWSIYRWPLGVWTYWAPDGGAP